MRTLAETIEDTLPRVLMQQSELKFRKEHTPKLQTFTIEGKQVKMTGAQYAQHVAAMKRNELDAMQQLQLGVMLQQLKEQRTFNQITTGSGGIPSPKDMEKINKQNLIDSEKTSDEIAIEELQWQGKETKDLGADITAFQKAIKTSNNPGQYGTAYGKLYNRALSLNKSIQTTDKGGWGKFTGFLEDLVQTKGGLLSLDSTPSAFSKQRTATKQREIMGKAHALSIGITAKAYLDSLQQYQDLFLSPIPTE